MKLLADWGGGVRDADGRSRNSQRLPAVAGVGPRQLQRAEHGGQARCQQFRVGLVADRGGHDDEGAQPALGVDYDVPTSSRDLLAAVVALTRCSARRHSSRPGILKYAASGRVPLAVPCDDEQREAVWCERDRSVADRYGDRVVQLLSESQLPGRCPGHCLGVGAASPSRTTLPRW